MQADLFDLFVKKFFGFLRAVWYTELHGPKKYIKNILATAIYSTAGTCSGYLWCKAWVSGLDGAS